MKRGLVFSMMILFLLVIAGCGPAVIETVSSTSEDGLRTVTVTGEQKAPLDPITVTVTLEYKGKSYPFVFNHQAGSLTKENCLIVWNTNESGVITLKFDDEGQQRIDFVMNDEIVQAIKQFAIQDVIPH